jgi:uncharacterized protein (TIGR03437 family)
VNPDLARVVVRLQPRTSNRVLVTNPIGAYASGLLAVVPSDMPFGLADVSVLLDGSVNRRFTVNVVRHEIGLFAVAGYGVGPSVAQNIARGTKTVANRLTSAALPGQYLTLWATGLGDLTTSEVTAEVAGKNVSLTYAGSAPGLPDLYPVRQS